MSEIINTATGELISEAAVRASIRRVIDHAESIWDEWAWQVENHTWTVLGYDSWDEMRRGEYGALTSVAAPRAERPELVARFRGAGLTQKQTASTLGVSQGTVSHYEGSRPSRPTPGIKIDTDIVDAEIVEDESNVVAIRPPMRGAQRDRAETYLNLIEMQAAKAAREVKNLTPEQIRRVRPKADLWTVGLRNSIEALQRLVNSLDPEENQ